MSMRGIRVIALVMLIGCGKGAAECPQPRKCPVCVECPSNAPPPAAQQVANSNDVEEVFLRPLLLDDRAEMEKYLAALPEGIYKQYDVPRSGKFYLDDVDDVIKDLLRKGRVWEPHIDNTLKKYAKPGTTVIDAGAHIGTHALSMSRFVGSHGRVYSFEPQKKLFRELVFNLKLNKATNVIPVRMALGAHTGVIEMSAAVPKNEGGTGVGSGGDKAELRALDQFPFRNISVIKIDVEGFEDGVLDGAQLTIKRWRPVIVIEIMGGNDYRTASPKVRARIDATKAKLVGLGYDVTQISVHDYLALPR